MSFKNDDLLNKLTLKSTKRVSLPSKVIHIYSNRNNILAARNAVLDALDRDRYSGSSYVLRGSCATRIEELVDYWHEECFNPRRFRRLESKNSSPSEWFFESTFNFRMMDYRQIFSSDGTLVSNPLFFALWSQKPIISVFNSEYFKKDDGVYIPISSFDLSKALECVYFLQFSKTKN